MDRLLARLERRLGRFAVPNLILYVVIGMGLVWLIAQVRPWVVERLSLDMWAVRHGELWRLVTFLFIPLNPGSFWFFVGLYFTWWVGSSLEQSWGAFRFNVYYLLGALGTLAGALLTGGASNFWIDTSLLLAFATIVPDMTILLFFVLPLKVKWLGIATAAWMGYMLARGNGVERAAIVVAFANYILFFAGHWRDVLRRRSIGVRQKARREELRSSAPVFGQRVCAVCGSREADGADIRVCSCEKCGFKPRAMCLAHARAHLAERSPDAP